MFNPFIEIDRSPIDHFLDAAKRGDVSEVANMLDAGMPVDICDGFG